MSHEPPPEGMRKPPWSAEAEQAVLGSLLLDNAAFDRVGDLVTEQSFWLSAHGEIYAITAAMIAANKPADILTVHDRLKASGRLEALGGLAYLNALIDSVPTAANARRYAEIVATLAQERALIAACDEAVEVARDGDTSLPERLEKIGGLFDGLQRQQQKKMPRALRELMLRAIDRYTDMSQGVQTPGWRTGIARLDRILGGGLKPGKVYGIAARPSVGKSTFAREIALSTAIDGLPTLVLSMEMPDDEVTDCLVARLGRIDNEHLQTGQLTDADWSAMTDAVDFGSKLPLYIDDDGGLTPPEIAGKARSIKGLKVLVLDYLQLAQSTLKNKTTNDEIAQISKFLKALAISMGIAVVVLSQLNRDVENRVDKEPQLRDLRDSGAIEQDLDVAIMLWTFRVLDDAESSRIVGVKVAKHRGGRKGRFALEFDAPRYLWTESSASLEPPTATERRGRHKAIEE